MAVATRFVANSSGQDPELKRHELSRLIGICMLQSKRYIYPLLKVERYDNPMVCITQ
jgi:hypothetical protein